MLPNVSKVQNIMPFYLEDNNLESSKRGFNQKMSMRIPEIASSQILTITPQKNQKQKLMEFDKLFSAIQPLTNNENNRSIHLQRWDAILNVQNDRFSQIQKDPNKKQLDESKSLNTKQIHKKLSKQIRINEIQDLKTFVNTPIQKNKVLKCTLHRDRSGFKTFYPQFSLRTNKQQKLLLIGKKQSGNRTSNIRISISKQGIDSKSSDYLGKVRSNFFGTDYSVFDSGDNPKKDPKTTKPRKLLAQIHYQNRFMMCNSGPKKMEAFIPDPQFEPQGNVDLRQLHKYNPNNIISMTNKLPKWNQKIGAYLLDLQDRASKPSIKNFILVNEDNQDTTLLLLGKVDDDNFNIDICHPLTVFQAFAIVLSSFDFKLASDLQSFLLCKSIKMTIKSEEYVALTQQ